MIYGDQFKGMDVRLAVDYVNPNELTPMQGQLHACESLFGDWSARVCLVMQDAADVESLRRFHERTGRPIFSHNPVATTNRRLVDRLDRHDQFDQLSLDGRNAKSCGLYYANAVWFLKRSGGMSGVLRQRRLAIEQSLPILRATFDQLDHLELIVAFGGVAYEALQQMFGLERPWVEARQDAALIPVRSGQKRWLVGVTSHPRARGVPAARMQQRLADILEQWAIQRLTPGSPLI